MRSQKKQSFVQGAAILAVAGIIVKIIGACYKIPLGAILGPVGMANFSIAYNIYALLFVLSTAGVPAAVSKMISETSARGETGEMRRIYRVAILAFFFMGLLGFAVMFFGAGTLSRFMGSRDSAASIKAIAPAVLFVSVSAINRGYFQGRSNMYPTAISEILEAIGKLAAGLIVAWCLKRAGFPDGAVSAGAVFGVTVGAALSALYFVFCRDGEREGKSPAVRRKRDILKELLSLAVPITVGAAVISITNVIDSALVMNLLSENSFSEYDAKWLYGAYNYAATIFNLPSSLITTLAISLIPAISAALAKRELVRVDKVANAALGIAMMIAFSAACGMAALSYDIVNLLYGAGIDGACVAVSARLLELLAFAVLPLAIVTVTNSVHQALGHPNVPVMSMLAGAVIKIISNFILVGRADINIYGAAVSTVFCYSAIAILNIAALKKYSFIEMSITKIFAKPAVMGASVFFTAKWFKKLISGTFGGTISTIFTIFVCVFVCVVCAFCIGAIGKDEQKLIFGDKKIIKFLNND